MYVTHPPQGWAWAFCVLALLPGAALGSQRGALILARNAGRAALAIGTGTAMLHRNAIAVTDMLIAFGLGPFAIQRLEMYLRGRRLLDEARRFNR